MAAEAASAGYDLVQIVALLGAGVVAVPIFRYLKLGSVLGYLAAGLVVGPYGLKLVNDPESILHLSELGVVLFLFIIGLEMEPARLWALRKQIFGLGVAQVVLAGVLLTGVGVLLGLDPVIAFVAGLGFVLTSTAVVMQVLEERGELSSPSGQKIVSVLLLEDLAIVPLLAVVALLAPHTDTVTLTTRLVSIAAAAGSVLLIIFLGRRIMNPVFRFLAAAKAREVMTSAALVVVLGAALIMQMSGLSMAMGAFLAGVLLSTSSFRHQLEADVEPFRGVLLGVFFLAVGMSLDLAVVASNWQLIAMAVAGYMVVKFLVIYALARLFRSDHREALERSVIMAQGGEFAFVLFNGAVAAGLFTTETNAIFTATVIISMVLTPLAVAALPFLLPKRAQSMDGVELADGLDGEILVIGFGRFGQIATQPLLARKHHVSIIDNDAEMVRAAGQFGMKVYYGDGTRLDILRAAGAANAELVLICIDKPDEATRIAELLRDEFPLTKVMTRAFDRGHALKLIETGVTYQLRETFESALTFGAATVMELGATQDEADEVIGEVRRRDAERFRRQMLGDSNLTDLLISNARDQARESGVAPPPANEEPSEPMPPVAPATPAQDAAPPRT